VTRRQTYRAACLTAALAWGGAPAPAAAQSLAETPTLAPLADALRTGLDRFQVPGAGMIVVRGGEILHADAGGVASATRAQPVDLHTVFPIGSNAKAFTATIVAMLVEEGRLGWDDPVARHLPELGFADPHLTERVTVRDLLAMRTGVASDILWLGAELTREEVLARLPRVSPLAPFRARWTYSNLDYLVAGALVERLTGQSWEAAIRERIFGPLEMTGASVGVPRPLDGNAVAAHVLLDGVLHEIEHPDMSVVAPAGGINASLADMAKWMGFQLTGRAADGRQLLSPGLLAEMRTPQMLMEGFTAYGFGWQLRPTYRGRAVDWATHDGSTLAAAATNTVVPGEEAAIVVLLNRAEVALSQALMLHAMDALLGLEPRDHVSMAAGERSSPAPPAPLDTAARPPLPLDAYRGRYMDPVLGALEVSEADGRLRVRRGRWVGDLYPEEGQRFTVVWRDPYFAAMGRMTASFDIEGGRAIALRVLGGRFERRGVARDEALRPLRPLRETAVTVVTPATSASGTRSSCRPASPPRSPAPRSPRSAPAPPRRPPRPASR
jgi:CubicO group peptidase (beta-lactamase class C family)